MKKKQTFFDALINAGNGIHYFLTHDRNGKIHAVFGFAAIALAIFLKIDFTEWILIVLCIGSVVSLEMINSAVEKLCDIVQSEYHPSIKIIKDVSAAAVLFASLASAVVGCIIFLPKIYILL